MTHLELTKKIPIEGLALFLFFTAIGIYDSYPLIRNLSTSFPYVFQPGAAYLPLTAGDHLQTYYWFWLLKDNLFGQSSLFTNPYEFIVSGRPLTGGYVQFPFSLLFLPLSVFGDVEAHNLLIILSFPMTGLAMYYLLRQWVSSRAAALVGAVIFCSAPVRQAQLFSGHINGYIYFLLPLFLFFFEKGYREDRPWFFFPAGLCLLSLAPMEPHLVYYFTLFLGLYLPARILGGSYGRLNRFWQRRVPEGPHGSGRLWRFSCSDY